MSTAAFVVKAIVTAMLVGTAFAATYAWLAIRKSVEDVEDAVLRDACALLALILFGTAVLMWTPPPPFN